VFKKEKYGFTLIEMLVAVGLFTVVIVITLTAILSIIDFQRKVTAFQNIQNNLNFALEVISKDLKTGDKYYCGLNSFDMPTGGANDIIPRSCLSGGQIITFRNSNSDKITYRFLSGRIERIVNDGQVFILTSININLNENVSKFYVVNAEDELKMDYQPRITITIGAKSGVKDKTTETFNLQTTISQLVLNEYSL